MVLKDNALAEYVKIENKAEIMSSCKMTFDTGEGTFSLPRLSRKCSFLKAVYIIGIEMAPKVMCSSLWPKRRFSSQESFNHSEYSNIWGSIKMSQNRALWTGKRNTKGSTSAEVPMAIEQFSTLAVVIPIHKGTATYGLCCIQQG